MHEGLCNRAPPKLKNRGAGREEENKHIPQNLGPPALILLHLFVSCKPSPPPSIMRHKKVQKKMKKKVEESSSPERDRGKYKSQESKYTRRYRKGTDEIHRSRVQNRTQTKKKEAILRRPVRSEQSRKPQPRKRTNKLGITPPNEANVLEEERKEEPPRLKSKR